MDQSTNLQLKNWERRSKYYEECSIEAKSSERLTRFGIEKRTPAARELGMGMGVVLRISRQAQHTFTVRGRSAKSLGGTQ